MASPSFTHFVPDSTPTYSHFVADDGSSAPTAPATPSTQPGFFENLGNAFGISKDAAAAHQQEFQEHPVLSLLKAAGGPAYQAASGLIGGVMRSGGEAYDAGQSLAQGNSAQATLHAISAIPVVGPALLKMSAESPATHPGQSYASQLSNAITPGNVGTGLGAAAQVAPALLGGLDEAAPERPTIPTPTLPSAARAGAVFQSLNQDLAQTPVSLDATAGPLQRATEIGVRGSSLPKSVSDLLTRSQSPIPMTFPEARDYQSSLSDLSTSDKLAMNGRMRGAVAQLNKGLFSDMRDAAETQGRGDDFADAMKEYRRQAQIKQVLGTLGKTAIGAAGAGTLYELLKSAQK